MIRSADLSHLIGDAMTEKHRDRYGVQIEGWIFDRGNLFTERAVKLHVTVDTCGRSEFKIDCPNDSLPELIELIACVALRVRQAASELVEGHTALEVMSGKELRPISVLESPEVA